MEHSHVPEVLTTYLHEYGDFAIFLVILFESFGMPLPGEVMLVTGGGLAAQGVLDPAFFFGSAFLAAVIGDNIGYVIGRFVGRRALIIYGSRVGLTAARYDWAEIQFRKYGPAIVAVARFFALLRQLNGLVAGSLGMHWLRFLVFNAIGAALWVGFWGTIAMFLGGHVEVLHDIARRVGMAGAMLFCIAVAGFLVWRRIRATRASSR